MKMDEFDQVLKNALEEKAPSGFTDSIIDKLVAKEQRQGIISPPPISGKGFIIFLLSLFVFTLISVSIPEDSVQSKYSIGKYVDRLLTGIHFQFTPSLKILVFSIAVICLFLIVDYVFRSRKMVQI